MLSPDGRQGHLLIFRELHNRQPRRTIGLKFLAGKTILLEDLQSGEKWQTQVSENGLIELEIPDAPGYRFLSYAMP